MKSMTGYGFSEVACNGFRLLVEISSINKKGLDLDVRLPNSLSGAEIGLREMIQKVVSRGRVTISVGLSEWRKKGAKSLPIQQDVLENYHRELRQLAKKLGCSQEISLSYLLTLPGVIKNEKSEADTALKQSLQVAFQKALQQFLKTREREGAFLSKRLIAQLQQIARVVDQIEKANPQLVQHYQKALLQRIESLGVLVSSQDERVVKEVAFFVDRCDVSEEITRLRAHIQEVQRLLKGKDSAGRNLDFLMQEMFRETNTIGSKANGLTIAKHVIAIKTELEKIREQVQNLE